MKWIIFVIVLLLLLYPISMFVLWLFLFLREGILADYWRIVWIGNYL